METLDSPLDRAGQVLRFGEFTLDKDRRELARGTERLAMQEFCVLIARIYSMTWWISMLPTT